MHANMDWLQSRVNISPDAQAVIDAVTDDSWTYKELYERANIIANYFVTKGVIKGDRVAILAPNHIGYLDFFFACMQIGAIFIPLNWRLGNNELTYVLQDSKPKLLGVSPDFKEKVNQTNVDAEIIEIASNDYYKHLTYERHDVFVELKEEDPLAMIYTGGTTGKPKGVVLSHRSILWNALNTIVSWDLSAKDVTLITTPMFHTGGLNVYTLPLLLAGGTVVLSPDFYPEKAVHDLIKYRCTVVLFVPTMYHMIIQTKEFQEATFPDMRVFVSGGAPCPHRIYEAFHEKGIAFKEGYGLTEAGPNNFYIAPEEAIHKIGSVGKPMMFNDIKIVKDDGTVAKANEVGELVLRGYHAFEYYWNKPEETAEVIRDGWIHTGDLVKQDHDGYVFIVGRKKDMIISGGENVYPLEIEHWLEANERINEAAVVGLPDEKWGEIVTAFVSLKADVTEEELKEYCNQKLTRYKVPKKFYILEELPKTHVGKINKALLKEKYSLDQEKV
ncbi:class I adenylate-forming enzyme family protein [Ornithinibacillus halotolerans]|uniref:Long-chain-fatty-acid--CoA ligase n=1 Tax=Ornithinibacillus halotolerans TaxID=1274357 RepID=A0A916W8K2_9BACI|nr:long-chain fatty acid--CoA ligase [Ornithinibacillus halotolerans]GGA75663.1 long-chain-fatty-acid--CoA ligase [Ornithinibacillus halotolerans]